MGLKDTIKKNVRGTARTGKKALHSVGGAIDKSGRSILHSYDDNRWLRLAATTSGIGTIAQLTRMIGHGQDSQGWKNAGASVSPIGTYFNDNAEDRRAAGRTENSAEKLGMSQQDVLTSDINRAYGMDSDGGAVENNLRNAVNDTEKQLSRQRTSLRGSERESVEHAHKQFAGLLAQLVAARGENAGTLNRSQVAINSLGGKAGAMAKHDATRELDTRLAADVTRQNAAAFTRGVSGSSFDKAARGKTIADYGIGRGNIANTLAEGDRTFRDTLDSQRRALVDRGLTLGRSAIDSTAILNDQSNAAKSAYNNLTGRALGQLLATSSDLVQNDQVQRAQGNLGFRGLMGSTPFTQSRSTGGSLSR